MENSNIIIRVPEPCHEDWNKMTPDDKGRFCASCCKSVVDFSNKTDLEIKQILIEHKDQKVCGHFKKSQLDRPLNIRLNLNELPKNMSITKIFAVAAFFIFGSMLFACTDQNMAMLNKIGIENPYIDGDDKKKYMMGDVMAEPVAVNTITDNPVNTDTVIVDEVMVDGKIACEIPVEKQYEPEHFVKGKVARPQYIQPIDEIKEVKTVTKTETMVSGGISVQVIEAKPLIVGQATVMQTDSLHFQPAVITNVENIETVNKASEVLIFPNPGKGDFTISYEVKKRGDVTADLFDLKGAFIKNLIAVPAQHQGKYKVGVDAGELANGIYIVNLVVNGEKVSKRLVVER